MTFDVAPAKSFPGSDYDLVAFFDCLHDMGDPVGAARRVLASLAVDGTWLIVEPFANDRVEQNFNPIGRLFYAASTMICTPASLAQEVGLGLGAQAGERRIAAVIKGRVSPASGGLPRLRSTWCSRPDPRFGSGSSDPEHHVHHVRAREAGAQQRPGGVERGVRIMGGQIARRIPAALGGSPTRCPGRRSRRRHRSARRDRRFRRRGWSACCLPVASARGSAAARASSCERPPRPVGAGPRVTVVSPPQMRQVDRGSGCEPERWQ